MPATLRVLWPRTRSANCPCQCALQNSLQRLSAHRYTPQTRNFCSLHKNQLTTQPHLTPNTMKNTNAPKPSLECVFHLAKRVHGKRTGQLVHAVPGCFVSCSMTLLSLCVRRLLPACRPEKYMQSNCNGASFSDLARATDTCQARVPRLETLTCHPEALRTWAASGCLRSSSGATRLLEEVVGQLRVLIDHTSGDSTSAREAPIDFTIRHSTQCCGIPRHQAIPRQRYQKLTTLKDSLAKRSDKRLKTTHTRNRGHRCLQTPRPDASKVATRVS